MKKSAESFLKSAESFFYYMRMNNMVFLQVQIYLCYRQPCERTSESDTTVETL